MRFFLATTFALISTAVTGLAKPSDLEADPKTLFGEMENGFSYIIRPNAEPPGQFSVRLHIAAGSLHEADDQRGLAHFLEHMVFNGSKNFTSAELIPKMQRLGIAFGAHANAYTSFDETVYMLDLPNKNPETLDLTFTVMRDFADGALLKKEEIESERGVILSEKNSRDSVGYRMMLKQFEYLLPGSRLMQRVPIGTEEVIKNASRERFTDFYTRFYTPERMTLIVVGDFKAEDMEKRVRESFISMTNPDIPGKNPPVDAPPSGFGLRSEIFVDPEITSDGITLYTLRPYTPQPDTKANRLERYPLAAAHSILSRRFAILAKKEDSPILSGGADRTTYFNMVESGAITVSPGKDQWKKAIKVMDQEFRRAFLHGFTQAELSEISAEWINAAEQAVKRAPTRESQGIAMSYVGAMNSEKVVITPEDNLALTKEGVAELTLDKIHDAFKSFWQTDDFSLVLTTNEAEEGAAELLRQLYLSSGKTKVLPPTEEKEQSFAYTSFGTAGEIVEEKKIEDLGITQLTLSNDVRVNLKPTDFEKNSVSLIANIGGGTFTMPQDKPGLDQFASALFQMGGLGKHSVDDLQRILAGRNVGAGLSIEGSSFKLVGRTTTDDLLLQLQLMCAHLTDPGFRPEAERQFKMQLPMMYNQIKHTAMGGYLEMQKHMTSGDYRSQFPSQKEAMNYSTEMVKKWLTPALTESSLELSIVGDFQIPQVIESIKGTFGALPKRKTIQPNYDALRKVTLPERPDQKTFTFDSKIPNATAAVAWAIPSAYQNQKIARRFNLIASILGDRMREEIRENLGGSYSPRSSANPHPELDYGYLQAIAQVKPEETEKYGNLMIELADKLAREGLSQDELERALKPLQSNLKKSKRENSYWLEAVLKNSHFDSSRFALARTRDTDYASITVAELNKLTAQYLKKENALRYEIVPQAASK